MDTIIYKIIILLAATIIVAALVFPLLLAKSSSLGFTDQPGARKSHSRPIPVIGGLSILITLLIVVFICPWLRAFAADFPVVLSTLIVMSITGVIDDRINIKATKRLFIGFSCALAVAASGIRIYSLEGFGGIYEIPVAMQYVLTIIIISGITNAINLLDGIDGLVGSLSFINCLVLACISFFSGQLEWGFLMLVICGSLFVFLRYNWQPARMFMGDGGSLLLGFLMAVTAIHLLHVVSDGGFLLPHHAAIAIVFSACFVIPVADTLRVFVHRLSNGRSPFSADRSHLHHKMIAHFMMHGDASRKIIRMHLLLIIVSIVLYSFLNISVLLLFQMLYVATYTKLLDFAQNYSRWYRKIKRMESDR